MSRVFLRGVKSGRGGADTSGGDPRPLTQMIRDRGMNAIYRGGAISHGDDENDLLLIRREDLQQDTDSVRLHLQRLSVEIPAVRQIAGLELAIEVRRRAEQRTGQNSRS